MAKDLVQKIDSAQLKSFEEDPVWQAFREVVEERIDIVRNELETGIVVVPEQKGEQIINKPVVIDVAGLKTRQGECAGLRYILRLPEIVKEIWKQDEESKKGKKEE